MQRRSVVFRPCITVHVRHSKGSAQHGVLCDAFSLVEADGVTGPAYTAAAAVQQRSGGERVIAAAMAEPAPPVLRLVPACQLLTVNWHRGTPLAVPALNPAPPLLRSPIATQGERQAGWVSGQLAPARQHAQGSSCLPWSRAAPFSCWSSKQGSYVSSVLPPPAMAQPTTPPLPLFVSATCFPGAT